MNTQLLVAELATKVTRLEKGSHPYRALLRIYLGMKGVSLPLIRTLWLGTKVLKGRWTKSCELRAEKQVIFKGI